MSPFFLLQKLDICTMFCLFSHKSSERNYLLLLSPITSKINKNKLSAHILTFYISFLPVCLYMPAQIHFSITHLLVYTCLNDLHTISFRYKLTLETIMLPQHNMLTNITVTQKNAVSISVNFLNKVSFKFCIIQFTYLLEFQVT